ncbi:glycosyltransferase [Hymenobacter sp. PAMC 26628]|uniref:glycosyltransferase n=1 Tax=Hymenobacter sp. PAMC 26628 TaxID=1484118 RepID=UPI00076FFC1A|nr:glycosyltransferase [Hymenobacter sp. PAMC 26628]AMJ64766.1 hypothetical protein AXW84_04455 [Hymenobacter sp. PAMC 26628]
MISVIICSRGPEHRKAVTESIASTIGVPYEVVIVDNSSSQYGICAAYNEGAARSKYELLCFAHEDLVFDTLDWGHVVARVLRDDSIGALGIAGGKWLAKVPSSWWGCGHKYLSINLHDRDKVGSYEKNTYSNPESKSLVDVAAVDGLWICTRKDVWQKHPFDAETFPDFHFYDVDFCANVYPNYRVCVTFEVNITHFSQGNFNNSWFVNADRFYCKYAKYLPLGVPTISAAEVRTQRYEVCKSFLLEIIKRKQPARLGYKYLAACIQIDPFNRHTLWLARHYAGFALRASVAR